MKPLAKYTLEQFKQLLEDYCKEHDPQAVKYPKWLRIQFWEYWTAKNPNGKKMYFQMEDKWNTGLRLATWVRNSQKDPRWKEQPKEGYKFRSMRFNKDGNPLGKMTDKEFEDFQKWDIHERSDKLIYSKLNNEKP